MVVAKKNLKTKDADPAMNVLRPRLAEMVCVSILVLIHHRVLDQPSVWPSITEPYAHVLRTLKAILLSIAINQPK